MLSTELPVTEWWDPEYDVFDVPGSPYDYQEAGADPLTTSQALFDAWWAAYDHVNEVVYIMTGERWYAPPNLYAHQLTAGPASVPYLGAWPWPCSCEYVVHRLLADPPPAGVEIVHNPVIATTFEIHSDCPQHGDDAHA